MEILEKCPICDQTTFAPFLTCKDSLSTLEKFELKKCLSCSFVFTSPRPGAGSLPRYYQSKAYISHSGKSAGLVDRVYLMARHFTSQWKIKLIKKYRKPMRLLDYGCGTGEFLRACQDQGWTIAGVEPVAEARQKAAGITGINIASELPLLENQQFDVITLWHVLEHVKDLNQTVSRLRSMLGGDGLLVIAVPNHESHDASFYKEFWAAYDVPRHLWHFTQSTMSALLTSHGLKLRAIEPLRLDSYYVSLLSEKYRAPQQRGFLLYLKGIIRGFLSNRKARRAMNYSSLIFIATP